MTQYVSASYRGVGPFYTFSVDSLECTAVAGAGKGAFEAVVGRTLTFVMCDNSWSATNGGGGVGVGSFLIYQGGGYQEEFLIELISDTPPSGSSGADSQIVAELQSTVASLQTTVATTQQAVTQTASTVSAMQSGLQSLLNAAAKDFDPVFAGAVFGFFYCTVFVFYSISKGIGAVLAAIKGGR